MQFTASITPTVTVRSASGTGALSFQMVRVSGNSAVADITVQPAPDVSWDGGITFKSSGVSTNANTLTFPFHVESTAGSGLHRVEFLIGVTKDGGAVQYTYGWVEFYVTRGNLDAVDPGTTPGLALPIVAAAVLGAAAVLVRRRSS